MMFKTIISCFIVVVLATHVAIAQKSQVVTSKELTSLVGCWNGILNYSGTIIRKPYTTTAALTVKQIGTSNKFVLLHVYTKETGDSSRDTITISKDGLRLNDGTIKSNRLGKTGSYEIVTEAPGFDHDNNTAAIVRQTYTIGKQRYIYKKQIQLQGQTDWLDREEFKYDRKVCARKKIGGC